MHAQTLAILQGATREALLSLMQQEDPNGCWTDDLAIGEGFTPLTHAEILAVLTDGEHDELAEWLRERLELAAGVRRSVEAWLQEPSNNQTRG